LECVWPVPREKTEPARKARKSRAKPLPSPPCDGPTKPLDARPQQTNDIISLPYHFPSPISNAADVSEEDVVIKREYPPIGEELHRLPRILPIEEPDPLGQLSPTRLPDMRMDLDRKLLDHFVQHAAPRLARKHAKQDANPYLVQIIPMAMDNPLIMSCLLSISAVHWGYRNPALRTRGLWHQTRATKTLAQLIPGLHEDQGREPALMASLLLCVHDLFEGSSLGWTTHLRGAKRLLLDALVAAPDKPRETAADEEVYAQRTFTSRRRFLLTLYRFLDSAATIATCKAPLLNTAHQASARHEEWHSEPPDRATALAIERINRLAALSLRDETAHEAIYGIPAPLYHLLDKVNGLADQRRLRVDERGEAAFQVQAALVQSAIEQWSFEYGGLEPAVAAHARPAAEDPEGRDRAAMRAATLAFEWGLRLRLHQIVRGYDGGHAIVREAVRRVVAQQASRAKRSPLESCLLIPLVLAGGSCGLDQAREWAVLHGRLDDMARVSGFGYLDGARRLVARVWAERRAFGCDANVPVNWARIRHEEMAGLAIF